MKIIVSHDVDHLTAWEHKSMLVPKFLIRATIEYFKGIISTSEYLLRYKSLIKNKWQNLDEIMEFNKANKIPATFFIGVNNGMGLDYPLKEALYWAQRISARGFDVGVHGISYENIQDIEQEYNILYQLLNKQIGIRMHYLRNNKETLANLSKVGYIYDSTNLKDENPYLIDGMWEFPLHIMEGQIFYQKGKRYTSKTLGEYKKITIERITELKNSEIQYLTLLFHDRYFDDSFTIWKEWYIWVIDYCKSQGYDFISYTDAIKELSHD